MLGCLCYGGGDWLMMYGDPTYSVTMKQERSRMSGTFFVYEVS